MRVTLVGDFRFDRLGASYRRAFEALGHEVKVFDTVEQGRLLSWWVRRRIPHRLTINSLAARRAGAAGYCNKLIEACELARPDLVLAFNGDFIMPETIRTLKSKGSRFAIFHADNPFPPHYNNRPETLVAARECDAYFIWSEALAERLRASGIPARYLGFAWDSEIFPFQGVAPEQPYDVTFIGGWDRGREVFLDRIARQYRVNIWGPGYWGSRTNPLGEARKHWQGKELREAEAAQVIGQSKIVLNLLRDQHYIDGKADGVIMRTFEVPGAGGFLLATRATGATGLFPEGEAGAYFGDVEECLEKIAFYLGDEDARRRLAGTANQLVGMHHTYQHRVEELLQAIA